MKNNDWTTQLRSKMARHQEEVPSGLWDEIERSLPSQPKPRPAILQRMRRYTAAAALLALIGGSVVLWHPWTDDTPLALQAPAPSTISTEPSVPTEAPAITTDDFAAPKEAPASTPARDNDMMIGSQTTTASPAQPRQDSLARHFAMKEETATPGNKREDITPITQYAGTENKELSATNTPEEEGAILQVLESKFTKSKSERHSSVGLFAHNNLASISERQPIGNYAMANSTMFNDESWSAKMSPRYSKKTKHHRPYSFGLSIQHPIGKRLALQTGLIYTQVRSDFVTQTPVETTKHEQVLHYVGIPLSVMYNLWQARNFTFYVNGGGQADLNVKATMKSKEGKKDIDNDRIQFSTLLGLGIQYQVIPSLGIYVEPSMRYYFDNGSAVENIFKDDPWKFSFHFGFRYNVP